MDSFNYSNKEFLSKYKEIVDECKLKSKETKRVAALTAISFLLVIVLPGRALTVLSLIMFFLCGAQLQICISQGKELRNRFLSKLGLDEDTAKCVYQFMTKTVSYLPLVQKICVMSDTAKYDQIRLLKKWYGIDDAFAQRLVFEKKYDKYSFDQAIKLLNDLELSERQSFMNKLFMLSVAYDGIHVDEWKFLMDMMKELKFNKNYIVYFKKRYGPLRTEFDDAECGNSSSTKTDTVSILGPYYAILGLTDGAADEEIKKAYHALALQHHPDLPKNAGRIEECEAMMAKINEAYEKVRG